MKLSIVSICAASAFATATAMAVPSPDAPLNLTFSTAPPRQQALDTCLGTIHGDAVEITGLRIMPEGKHEYYTLDAVYRREGKETVSAHFGWFYDQDELNFAMKEHCTPGTRHPAP